jgi:glycyl-tRNA synthetase beta chain
VVYQQALGTLADKTSRISVLAAEMAGVLGQDVSLATRAGSLCKCDLLTDMVGEFPELQGTMGKYYALTSGEHQEVAEALNEQYMPRQAGGPLPLTATGRLLAIADKLDTLVGIFAIGQAPSGDRDPFGLRRAALGSLRIMIECRLGLNLRHCLETAVRNYGDIAGDPALIDAVFGFMMERLRRYYLDDAIRPDVFDAVLARQPEIPYDFHLRIHGVTNFCQLPEAASLAAANKRISNILKQSNAAVSDVIDVRLLSEPAEQQLFAALNRAGEQVSPALARNDYSSALAMLAGLRDTVDAFFDQVLVMCDDVAVRNNRLAILHRLGQLFLSAADIARLQTN